MKKVLAGVFAVLLLLNITAVPVGADDIQTELVNFICQEYNFQSDDLIEAEYYQVYLEYTDLNLSILHWLTQGEDYCKGMAAWVAETGEYLADDGVYALMEAERLLAAKEYQRLQEQAGKMDISLYKQIQENPQAEYQVYITPVYKISDNLNEEIQALYEEYGLEAPEDIGNHGRVPGYTKEGQGQSGSSSGGALPPDLPQTTPQESAIEPVPQTTPFQEPAIDPALPRDLATPTDLDKPVASDCEPAADFYQPYPEEFYSALNTLYNQGYAEATSNLSQYLDGIGAQYQVNPGYIVATLTAAQIQAIQGRPEVQWVSSYMAEQVGVDLAAPAFTAQNDDGSRLNSALGTNEAAGESSQGKTRPMVILLGGFLGLSALAIFLIIKR